MAFIATLGVMGGFLFLRDLPPFSTLEGQTLTWRFRLRGPMPPPPDVAIVAVDDRSIAALRGWPLARRHFADAIETLNRAGARAVALDFLLLDREQPSDGLTLTPGDALLRDALERHRRTVLSLALTFGDTRARTDDAQVGAGHAALRVVQRPRDLAGEGAVVAQGALAPLSSLREVTNVGHVNVLLEDDGGLRHINLAIKLGEHYVRALPLELARLHRDLAEDQLVLVLGHQLRLGEARFAIDRLSRLPVNYLGPPGTVPTYSLIDVLQNRFPADAFAGKAVMLGAIALGVGDSFATPFSGALAGVEVLATAAHNLIAGTALRSAGEPVLLGLLAIILLGLGAAILGRLPSPLGALAAILGLASVWFFLAQLAFTEWTMWINMTFPTLSLLANAALVGARRSVAERRLRRRIERERRNLSRYHSPLIADLLANEGQRLAESRQDAAILFVDMAGFTGRMETMPADEMVTFLRNFHARIEQAVLAHGGFLEQFTGDGAMVIFGVPRAGPDDSARAIACAIRLVADIRDYSGELERQGKDPVRIGIGVHFGPVVIARLGGREQQHLTAAGDTVNVASRLEALTRILGASVVASAAVIGAVREAGREDLLEGFERLPAQPIRGRSGRLDVWILRQS
ncbi:MAG: adenylate/guanylate cyclase domain-containing protein [Alphaproteobacteria bacterium]|nr:adenylate/guanylate cyclase domain-containing protein [Alphaproteobacteria bacterium]